MGNHLSTAIFAIGVLGWGACLSRAAIIAPGATVALSGLDSLPSGEVVAQKSIIYASYVDTTFTGAGTEPVVTYQLSAAVYRESATGHLDFVYTYDSIVSTKATQVTVTGFAGVEVDAAFTVIPLVGLGGLLEPLSGEIYPQDVLRSSDGGSLFFRDWILGSDRSPASVVLRTSALEFTDNATLQVYPQPPTGFAALPAVGGIFGPVAVPEPTSITILSIPALLLLCRFKGRRLQI
jgi:hypothetical protein